MVGDVAGRCSVVDFLQWQQRLQFGCTIYGVLFLFFPAMELLILVAATKPNPIDGIKAPMFSVPLCNTHNLHRATILKVSFARFAYDMCHSS